MNDKASVTSIEALRTFRASLIRFVDEARASLSEAESSIGRTIIWLRQDQFPLWKKQVTRDRERVAQARSRLLRRETTAIQDSPRCVEERLALNAAKHRLEASLEKLETTRTWIRRLEHAGERYAGKVERMASLVDTELPTAAARLARMIEALDAYVAVAPDITTAAGAAGLSQRTRSMSRPELDEPFQRLVDGLRGRMPEGARLRADPVDHAVWVHVEPGAIEGGRYFIAMVEDAGIKTGFIGVADPAEGPPESLDTVRLDDLRRDGGPLADLGELPTGHLAIIARAGLELVVDDHDRPVERPTPEDDR